MIPQSRFVEFFIGMVYFGWYLGNPHVQAVQDMFVCGKGGRGCFRVSYHIFKKIKSVFAGFTPLQKSLELSLSTQITSSPRLWEELICVVKLNFCEWDLF